MPFDPDPRPPLRLRRSEDGTAPRFPTEVHLDADGSRLRITFRCRDDRRWATLDRRDDPLWQEEVVEVFIAPGAADPTTYFELEVNPLGALFDARVHNPHGRRETLRVDTSWDCPGIDCRVGSTGDSNDWWAELTLPWRSLLEPSDREIPGVWRVGFFRVERPDGAGHPEADEYSCWSPTLRRPADFHVPERLGFLLLDGTPDPRAHGPRVFGTELPAVRLPTAP